MNLLEKLVSDYINLSVENLSIKLPYYNISDDISNKNKTFGRFEGKGTANQLYYEIYELFQNNPNLKNLDPNNLQIELKKQGIGIDCSGYVYNILNEYVHAKTGIRLDNSILRYNGLKGRYDLLAKSINRVRKISAKVLTSNLNSKQINSIKEIQIGDMIRLTHKGYDGKHVAIIIYVDKQQILYTHSSDSTNITKQDGPHISKIRIKDHTKGLEVQEWEEETNDGSDYCKECFLPDNDDYICRLKVLC